MKTIDRFLLGKFQAFSDFFQDLVGVNNFWLARLSLVVASLISAFIVCLIFFLPIYSSMVKIIITIIFTSIGFMCVRIFSAVVDAIEQQCFENKTSRNNLEVSMMPGRIFFLFMCLAVIVFLVYMIMNMPPINSESLIDNIAIVAGMIHWIFVTCFLYLLSCTPKPPKTSKVKKLFKKLSQALSPKQIVVQTVRAN